MPDLLFCTGKLLVVTHAAWRLECSVLPSGIALVRVLPLLHVGARACAGCVRLCTQARCFISYHVLALEWWD